MTGQNIFPMNYSKPNRTYVPSDVYVDVTKAFTYNGQCIFVNVLRKGEMPGDD